MAPQVDVIVKPSALRFSVFEGVPVYYAISEIDMALDGIEVALGIEPSQQELFDSNLGFLPTCNTVLIRGKRNIIVDPNNFHIGFYGTLGQQLKRFDLSAGDIDIVVNTHFHHDHNGSNFLFRGKRLVLGEGEIELAETVYWPGYVRAHTRDLTDEIEIVGEGDGKVQLDEGVYAIHTPGHTPGSLSVLVEGESERVAIIGDLALTAEQYVYRKMSHWYTPADVAELNRSLDKIAAWNPTLVIPGHDSPIRVQ